MGRKGTHYKDMVGQIIILGLIAKDPQENKAYSNEKFGKQGAERTAGVFFKTETNIK